MEEGADRPQSPQRAQSAKSSKERLEDLGVPPEETDALGQESQEKQQEIPVLAEPVERKLRQASADFLSVKSSSSFLKDDPPIVVPSSESAVRVPTQEGQVSKERLQSEETLLGSSTSIKEKLSAAGREDAGSPDVHFDKRGPTSAEKLSEARTEAHAEKVCPELAQRGSQELVPLKTGSAISREGAVTPALFFGSQGPPSESEVTSLETGMGTSQKGSETSRTQTTASSATPVQEEDSIVSSAFPGMLFEEKTKPLSNHPLSLSWVFGYNSQLPVFNLLDEDQRVILYVSAHTAVIHDIFRNKQYLLQGHSSCISCICVSDDRRWVATADRGPESLVIVWDSYSAVPVHTIFDSHPEGGVGAIAISHDSKFLATVGAGEVQKVSIWRWTSMDTKPVCSVEILPQFGFQKYIAFSSKTQKDLVSNSVSQVIFYSWEDNVLICHAPLLTDKTFNKVVGLFTQSRFHFSYAQTITSTSEGKLVIWEVVCPPLKPSSACDQLYHIKAIKLVHLQKDAITVLAITDEFFVTCDVKGHVKFYDGDLQLMHWYSQFRLGPIQSISFSKKPVSPGDITQYPESCTLSGKPFVIRNFILATLDAVVIHIKSEGTKVTKCLEEPKDAVHAIVCHPSKPLLAKGSHCGLLKVWSYVLNKYLVSRIFKGESISCLCYNPDGSLLAAGFLNGSLYILDSISLENDCPEPFQYSRGPITIMSFSHNSEYLATADENLSLNIYKKVVEEKKVWDRLAALHSHYKPIRTLLFGVQLDSNEPRLLSLGEDRLLVEYDLENTVKDELAVIRRDRIEQSAVPKYIVWYPPITTEYFFLTVNNHYKTKIYNVTTMLCRKTALGPTYGSPLEKIIILPLAEGQDPQKRYLAYITKDKIGLQILPIDGNPHKSSAFICHPTGVADLACSYTGRYLFTAGGSDSTVMKWDVNLDALDAAVFLGGKDLIPFYNLLEGGREGEFFKELEDYFYYAQLVHQGIDTMEPRKVSTHIPLEQMPFVMRAMGFYPSEEQVEDMLNEVKFSEFLETGKQVTHINLGDFIKLYVNHRPAFGLASAEIQNAFRLLGYENEDHEATMNRDDLLLLLQHKGEHLTEEELAEYLTTLLGFNPEGGRSEVGTYDPTGADEFIQEEIPEEITAAQFTKDILGLPIPEPMEVATETQTSDEPTSSSFLSLKFQ